MTIDTDDLLNSIMESLDRIRYIESEDIPSIALYMDQVTTFMNNKLRSTTRNPQDDKILTKTMINNYAKNNLLPPPEKKKYTKDHIMVLVFIYYLKGIVSFNDIQTILQPITEKYFQNDSEFNLEEIYKEIFEMEKGQKDKLKDDIVEKYGIAEGIFKDAPKKDEDFLKLFGFISLLGYDVYIKKLLIEKLVDGYREGMTKESKKKPEQKKNDINKEK